MKLIEERKIDKPETIHLEWATELRSKYPELVKFTVEQLAIIWSDYSDKSSAAGWITDSKEDVEKVLKHYSITDEGDIRFISIELVSEAE